MGTQHPNEFHKLLREMMTQECKHLLNKEEIEQWIRKQEVIELVGDRWVVWLNRE